MIRRTCVLISVLTLAAVAAAQEQRVPIVQSWQGRISNEQAKAAPKSTVIATNKAWEKIWKDWGLKGDAPKIDFAKHLIVFTTGNCSVQRIQGATLEKGDLKLAIIGTDDIRPDHAYHIIQVSRDGVKTVGGKAIDEK